MTHTAPDAATSDLEADLDDLRRIGTDLTGGVPDGDPATAWQRRRDAYKLVGPLNRRKFTVIVVGTGLAGAGAAAPAESPASIPPARDPPAPTRPAPPIRPG